MPNETPRTIQELKAWYVAHNLPPEEITRFFIGQDIHAPKAFGIYQDGDQFIVYKNKADGSRAVRYHGPDEGYAVNELYQRLKQEIANQKAHQMSPSPTPSSSQTKWTERLITLVVALIIGVIMFFCIKAALDEPDRGYYHFDDRWFYYNLATECWYEYANGWGPAQVDKELQDNWKTYYVNRELTQDMGVTDISLTEYYSTTDSSSSWDSSDSWDFDFTDWDSDW